MKKALNFLSAALLGLALLFAPFSKAVAQNTTLNGNILLAASTVTLGSVSSYTGTLNNKAGKATTESTVAIGPGSSQDFTINSTAIAAADLCFASVATTGTGRVVVGKVTPAAGSLVVTINNTGLTGSASTSAAMVITYVCFKP